MVRFSMSIALPALRRLWRNRHRDRHAGAALGPIAVLHAAVQVPLAQVVHKLEPGIGVLAGGKARRKPRPVVPNLELCFAHARGKLDFNVTATVLYGVVYNLVSNNGEGGRLPHRELGVVDS